jgi:molybdenum cofactor synthesis domain-containing protein
MQAEIVVIGTELLLGQIIDTNAAYLAQQLSSIGVDLYYKSTVGDNKGRIVEVLKLATGRSDIVITTGGIGPTLDDMTRESVAEVVGVSLQLQPHLLEQIKHMMGSRYTENNARQAYIPGGSVAIENPVGTAPGFIAPTPRGGVVVSLPGVPNELRYLTECTVVPYLKERFKTTSAQEMSPGLTKGYKGICQREVRSCQQPKLIPLYAVDRWSPRPRRMRPVLPSAAKKSSRSALMISSHLRTGPSTPRRNMSYREPSTAMSTSGDMTIIAPVGSPPPTVG